MIIWSKDNNVSEQELKNEDLFRNLIVNWLKNSKNGEIYRVTPTIDKTIILQRKTLDGLV